MFRLMEGWLFLDALLSLKTNSGDLLILGGAGVQDGWTAMTHWFCLAEAKHSGYVLWDHCCHYTCNPIEPEVNVASNFRAQPTMPKIRVFSNKYLWWCPVAKNGFATIVTPFKITRHCDTICFPQSSDVWTLFETGHLVVGE